MAEGSRPIFDRRIFWDVDADALDIDQYADWVIVRVFERGDVEDIRQCRRYFGDEMVREALKTAKFLPLGTLHFVSTIFNIPLNEFRCYTLRLSNPGLLPY